LTILYQGDYLFGIGAVSLYGITYYNYLAVDTQWTQTAQYNQFIEKEGYVVRLGSSLLHLGVVIVIFDFLTFKIIHITC
jgi:nitrate reductase gamma subunit